MEFTDRMMATDRSVASYRRFAHCTNDEATANMLVDLLHWHGRFADFSFTLEKAHDMLIDVLDTFTTEFEAEKAAPTPLRGERLSRRRHIEDAEPMPDSSMWDDLRQDVRDQFPEIDYTAVRRYARNIGATARLEALLASLEDEMIRNTQTTFYTDALSELAIADPFPTLEEEDIPFTI